MKTVASAAHGLGVAGKPTCDEAKQAAGSARPSLADLRTISSASSSSASTASLVKQWSFSYAFGTIHTHIKRTLEPFVDARRISEACQAEAQTDLETLVRECRTGDLILQGTTNEADPIGPTIVGLSRSRNGVSHAMLVWRDPETDTPYALTSHNWVFFPASLPSSLLNDYLAGKTIDGVQMHPLFDFTAAMGRHKYFYYWRPLFRRDPGSGHSIHTRHAAGQASGSSLRLQTESEEAAMTQRIFAFYRGLVGRKYPSDIDMYRRFLSFKRRSSRLEKPGDKDGYQCAEIACLALETVGVLRGGVFPWWNASAANFEPMHTIDRLNLCTDAFRFGACIFVAIPARDDTLFSD